MFIIGIFSITFGMILLSFLKNYYLYGLIFVCFIGIPLGVISNVMIFQLFKYFLK